MSDYVLNLYDTWSEAVAVVGCGGTGGFVAEGLCRMLSPRVKIILVDHDRVEEGNLLRQNFHTSEVGKYKSQALGERLARQYGRAVGWSVVPFGENARGSHPYISGRAGIIIGCVDNAQARQCIADSLNNYYPPWWVDAGNGLDWGQVLIGNGKEEWLHNAFEASSGLCYRLPLPIIQQPELLSPPPAPEAPDLSCAQLVATGDQDPTINQAMAALVLQVVKRLFQGSCPWMALYLDLNQGTLNPVMASPENVSRITRIRTSRLMRTQNPRR